jgi:hypothetical protein
MFRLQWNAVRRLHFAGPAFPMRFLWLSSLVVLAGCQREDPAPALKSLAPAPLQPLQAGPAADGGREAAYHLKPAPVWGEAVPEKAARLQLLGTTVQLAGIDYAIETPEGRAALLAQVGKGAVLLVPDADTYLAQIAPLLAALDDGAVETWLLHPAGKVAFHLALRDAPSFDAWLHEPKPGALRIIQRQDGLELVSNMGKLPGGDANGPTVPRRGGQLDVGLAREGLERLKTRFTDADTLCVVPSFATEVRETGALLTAAWSSADGPLFTVLCLVYPRPPDWREAPGAR